MKSPKFVSAEAKVRLRIDDRRLGFDCCAVCGRKDVRTCPACRRVSYCSRRCRRSDRYHPCSILGTTDDNDDDERGAVDFPVDFNLKKIEGPDAWWVNLIKTSPDLSVNQLALISYPLSLAWVLEQPVRRVLLIGAGPAEASVPPQLWPRTIKDLHLVGPEIPKTTRLKVASLNIVHRRDKFTPGSYDVVVAFNPGLTCPDYDWSAFKQAPRPPVLVLFAHTRKELLLDVLELQADPASLFVAKNPFHCPKWRQSGTFANDVYRKHRWCAILRR